MPAAYTAPCLPLEGKQTLRLIILIMITPTCPIHSHPPSQTSVDISNSNKCKHSALDDTISMSGGTSEGGGSTKCSVTRPSGLVALNAVATQLGEFSSKFEKVMML